MVLLFLNILLFIKPILTDGTRKHAYLSCTICEDLSRKLMELTISLDSNKNNHEMEIAEIVENICNVNSKYGKWILHYNVTVSENGLKITADSALTFYPSHCRKLCNHLQAACAHTFLKIDKADVALSLIRRSFEKDYLCKVMKDECKDLAYNEKDWSDIKEEKFERMTPVEFYLGLGYNALRDALPILNFDSESDKDPKKHSASYSPTLKALQIEVSKYKNIIGEQSADLISKIMVKTDQGFFNLREKAIDYYGYLRSNSLGVVKHASKIVSENSQVNEYKTLATEKFKEYVTENENLKENIQKAKGFVKGIIHEYF